MKIAQLHLIPGPDTHVSVAERYSHIWQMLDESNGCGYEAVWFTEHHHSNYSYTGNPLMLLTKAASIAPEMRLGTGVLVLPLWHPLRLAEDIATLDLVSGGRVDVGIGRGYQPFEFEALGVDLSRNREMFNEATNIIVDAWTKDDFEYDGRFWKVPPTTVIPKPMQQPHPPLWMAATTPPSIRAAVQKGYHLMTGAGAVLAELEQRNAYIDSVLKSIGKSPDGIERSVNRYVVCTTDEHDVDLAVDALRWSIRASRSLTSGHRPISGVNRAERYDGEPEPDIWRSRMIAGNPDECLAQLGALAATGTTYTLAMFDVGGMDPSVAMRSLKLFNAEVAPAISEMAARSIDEAERSARVESFLTDGPKYVGV